uniref:Putative secreted protein n=1 Tax=Anopheles darlingi TaxID=43151 RepID=A0A2M4D8K8_ANODA
MTTLMMLTTITTTAQGCRWLAALLLLDDRATAKAFACPPPLLLHSLFHSFAFSSSLSLSTYSTFFSNIRARARGFSFESTLAGADLNDLATTKEQW